MPSSLTRIVAETTHASLQLIHDNKKLLSHSEHLSSTKIQEAHSDIAKKHYYSACFAIAEILGGIAAGFIRSEPWKTIVPSLLPVSDKISSSVIQGFQQIQSGVLSEEQNLLQQHQDDQRFCASTTEMIFNTLKEISRQESQEIQG